MGRPFSVPSRLLTRRILHCPVPHASGPATASTPFGAYRLVEPKIVASGTPRMSRKTSISFAEAAKIAASSLWAHKLRSILTLLGVVIGVTSVIAVVSLIGGLNGYVSEKVFNLGTDVFLVTRGPRVSLDVNDYIKTLQRKKLTLDDFYRWSLPTDCRSCTADGAELTQSNAQVIWNELHLQHQRPRLDSAADAAARDARSRRRAAARSDRRRAVQSRLANIIFAVTRHSGPASSRRHERPRPASSYRHYGLPRDRRRQPARLHRWPVARQLGHSPGDHL